jgi:hypothetical protein
MRPLGKVIDGSTSLFETERVLYNSIGHAILLGQFTHVHQEYLLFVQVLLNSFCSLGICCALTGLYPAEISGMLGQNYGGTNFHMPFLHCKITFAILGLLFHKAYQSTVGSFGFRFMPNRDHGIFPIIRLKTFGMSVSPYMFV